MVLFNLYSSFKKFAEDELKINKNPIYEDIYTNIISAINDKDIIVIGKNLYEIHLINEKVFQQKIDWIIGPNNSECISIMFLNILELKVNTAQKYADILKNNIDILKIIDDYGYSLKSEFYIYSKF